MLSSGNLSNYDLTKKCLTYVYVGMIFRKEKVSVGLSQTDRYTLFYSVLKISFPLKSWYFVIAALLKDVTILAKWI